MVGTLRLVQEAKLHRLVPGGEMERPLEASGVLAHDGRLIVIFDNDRRLMRIDISFAPRAENAWLGEEAGNGTSGHEDVTYNAEQDRFYLLIEAVAGEDGVYRSEVVELDRRLALQERHALPWEFASDNKGFEGLTYLRRGGEDFVLALCEGNGCQGGSAGKRPGRGRIQIFRREARGWQHAGTLKLPPSAEFTDYSSLDVRDQRLVVLSQESARIWLGTLHPGEWAFLDEGTVHALPRTRSARRAYCTPEGVAWINADHLVVVSDRRKRDDPKRCAKRDQSVHLFRIS